MESTIFVSDEKDWDDVKNDFRGWWHSSIENWMTNLDFKAHITPSNDVTSAITDADQGSSPICQHCSHLEEYLLTNFDNTTWERHRVVVIKLGNMSLPISCRICNFLSGIFISGNPNKPKSTKTHTSCILFSLQKLWSEPMRIEITENRSEPYVNDTSSGYGKHHAHHHLSLLASLIINLFRL